MHDGGAGGQRPAQVLGARLWSDELGRRQIIAPRAGEVRPVPEGEWTAEHLAVNREFLLDALDAGAAGQLVLELDGPIRPLAVRVPGDGSRFSILMPVRQ